MARSTVISSKPLSWATPSRNLLVVAGTMFAGWLAASDAYGFHRAGESSREDEVEVEEADHGGQSKTRVPGR